jgi:hypothetical protein
MRMVLFVMVKDYAIDIDVQAKIGNYEKSRGAWPYGILISTGDVANSEMARREELMSWLRNFPESL